MDNWVTGKINLLVKGTPLLLEMTVPANPIKPQRMLPIFHQIANSFTELGINAIEKSGKTISCKTGCGACCRQTVPLAEIEAYQIAALVENLPEPRRTEIKNRFDAAFDHFQKIGWFERLANCAELSDNERKKIVSDYFFEGMPCPFLENESCSIYSERPLACREYMVTSPAKYCASFSSENIKTVGFPIKPAESLRTVGQSRELLPINFIPLVMALDWVDKKPENFAEKTGEQWMADFFGNIIEGDATN